MAASAASLGRVASAARHVMHKQSANKAIRQRVTVQTHLLRSRRHLLDLFVKDSLYPLSHSRDCMVRAIKQTAILEDQADVVDVLVGVEVARVVQVRVWLLRIGGRKLALDGGEIHRLFDNIGIMRYIKSDRVDRVQKRSSIFHFAKVTDC